MTGAGHIQAVSVVPVDAELRRHEAPVPAAHGRRPRPSHYQSVQVSTKYDCCSFARSVLCMTIPAALVLVVELQALKGLHALLLKHPEQMAGQDAVLGVWIKPIMSRLLSSDRATREQARLLLQEAANQQRGWSADTEARVQACVVEYVLPSMKMLMDREKPIEALQLWALSVVLMKKALVADLTVLNSVLYVPETVMSHVDAAVRLMGMEAWSHLVASFCDTKEWLAKKSIVQLLVQPVVVALEVEPMRNVVHAAFSCWKRLLSAAIEAFNEYCDSHSVDEAQHDANKWKRWFDEIVRVPVATICKHRLQSSDNHHRMNVEIEQYLVAIASMWNVASTSDVDDTAGKDAPPGSLSANPIGLALLLPDVFSTIQALIGTDKAVLPVDSSEQLRRDLVLAIWNGFCRRMWEDTHASEKPQHRKLRLRLARLCLDFAFGFVNSSSGDKHKPENNQVAPTVFRWQMDLLSPLVAGPPSPDVLTGLLVHPKSKVSDIVVSRLSTLRETQSFREALEGLENSGQEMKCKLKSHVIPAALIVLVLEAAAYMGNHEVLEKKKKVLAGVCTICRSLLQCTKQNDTSVHPDWIRTIRFVEHRVSVGESLANDADDQADMTRFAALCMGTAREEEIDPEPDTLDVEDSASQRSSIANDLHITPSPAKSARERPHIVETSAPSASSPEASFKPMQTPTKSMETARTGTTTESPDHRQAQLVDGPIYPELTTCTDGISHLYRHFPMAFRPLLSLYKIKTIGDLSSTRVSKVKTFGLRDPVDTVLRALEEYDSRGNGSGKCAQTSPYHQRTLSSPTRRTPPTPPSASTSPSPRRSTSKRPGTHQHRATMPPPLILENQRKRARRSLQELNSDDGAGDSAVDEATSQPKLADRARSCLPTGVGSSTHVIWPGEDSQEQALGMATPQSEANSQPDEKMDVYAEKLLEHLRRSAHYVDKLVSEEESLQRDSSLRTDGVNMNRVRVNIQKARDLVATLNLQLNQVVETNAQRSRNVPDGANAERIVANRINGQP